MGAAGPTALYLAQSLVSGRRTIQPRLVGRTTSLPSRPTYCHRQSSISFDPLLFKALGSIEHLEILTLMPSPLPLSATHRRSPHPPPTHQEQPQARGGEATTDVRSRVWGDRGRRKTESHRSCVLCES
jgi:hypothetical protein